MIAETKDAYNLLHDGAIALSRVETAGIRVDESLLDKRIEQVTTRIGMLSERLMQSREWREWRKKYGRRASLGSRNQLGEVLSEMGHDLKRKEKTKRVTVDEKALEGLDCRFVKDYLEVEKLKKLNSTYLKGVRRELVNGFVYPFFNLHTVKTYRSSSDRPNFQNIPIRDKVIGRLIRSCFVPRDGHVLVEIDFSALEVRVAACYHRDPVMIKYIETGYDLHREMAAKCYLLEPERVSKEVRFYAKNQFVFPQFYGSYFRECAENLWHAIDRAGLNVDGKSLKDHLAEQGIEGLGRIVQRWGDGKRDGGTGRIETQKGTFYEHVRQVEDEFWNRRFKVYRRWREDWYEKYLERGWFPLLTGFREEGVYKRNDVINHPVQGAAFHCLLWCLIELVKWTGKNRMKSKVVGQIHDSLLADVHRTEVKAFVEKAVRLMTEDIRRAWSWIVVPMEVEIEVGEKNWWEMRELKG